MARLEADPAERHVASVADEDRRTPPLEFEWSDTPAPPRGASPPDISEPHALTPESLRGAPNDPGRGPVARRGGFIAVGLNDVLGPNSALPPSARPTAPPAAGPPPTRATGRGPQVEGLTAVSGPSGPVKPATTTDPNSGG